VDGILRADPTGFARWQRLALVQDNAELVAELAEEEAELADEEV